jgi:hypothetical protein
MHLRTKNSFQKDSLRKHQARNNQTNSKNKKRKKEMERLKSNMSSKRCSRSINKKMMSRSRCWTSKKKAKKVRYLKKVR